MTTKLTLVKPSKSAKSSKRKAKQPMVDANYDIEVARRRSDTQYTSMNSAISFISAALGQQFDSACEHGVSWPDYSVEVRRTGEDTLKVEINFDAIEGDKAALQKLYAVLGWATSCGHELEVDSATQEQRAELFQRDEVARKGRDGQPFLLTSLVEAVSFISATLGEETSGGMANSVNWSTYAAADDEGNVCDPVWLEKTGPDTFKLKVYFWAAEYCADIHRKLYAILGWAAYRCIEVEIEQD